MKISDIKQMKQPGQRCQGLRPARGDWAVGGGWMVDGGGGA